MEYKETTNSSVINSRSRVDGDCRSNKRIEVYASITYRNENESENTNNYLHRQSTSKAIKIAQHDIEHDRTKHIDIKHFFIRDEIDKKEIIIKWIRTEQQIADIFTKSLPLSSFTQHRDKLIKQQES